MLALQQQLGSPAGQRSPRPPAKALPLPRVVRTGDTPLQDISVSDIQPAAPCMDDEGHPVSPAAAGCLNEQDDEGRRQVVAPMSSFYGGQPTFCLYPSICSPEAGKAVDSAALKTVFCCLSPHLPPPGQCLLLSRHLLPSDCHCAESSGDTPHLRVDEPAQHQTISALKTRSALQAPPSPGFVRVGQEVTAAAAAPRTAAVLEDRRAQLVTPDTSKVRARTATLGV
jgi:hypothetical protein